AARRVDVQVDVLVRVVGLEVQQLRHDQVPHLIVDRRAQEHDAFLQQPRVDVERPLPAVGLLDDDGNQVILHSSAPWSRVGTSEEPSAEASSRLRDPSSDTPSAASTNTSRAFERMISPASDVTCPERSRVRATSLTSRPRAWPRSAMAAWSSSALTWIPSWRATASRTRSALMA